MIKMNNTKPYLISTIILCLSIILLTRESSSSPVSSINNLNDDFTDDTFEQQDELYEDYLSDNNLDILTSDSGSNNWKWEDLLYVAIWFGIPGGFLVAKILACLCSAVCNKCSTGDG